MPFEDGTNREKEDPEPALDWKSIEDLTDVVLYGQPASPPVVKCAIVLKYYKVDFKFVELQPGKGYTSGASYKKIPVLTVKDRAINDSCVILRCIFKVLDTKFDQKIEDDVITYGLQLAIEKEVFEDAADFRNYASVAAGMTLLGYVPLFVWQNALIPSLGISKSIAKKNPDLKSATAYASEFKSAFTQDSTFWGGSEPGAADLSAFGTFYPFVKSNCLIAKKILADSNLTSWYDAMLEKTSDILD